MRHFTDAAKPTIAIADRKGMFDGLPQTMREAFDAAHERSEDEFVQLFGRQPDHCDPLDVDTCWRLFLVELQVLTENAFFNGEGDEGAEESRLLGDLLDHYREAHEKARRDYIPDFLAKAGLTQKEFAQTLGRTEHSVTAWKKGAFSDKGATVPDWLMAWCSMWLAAPTELRRRIVEQQAAGKWTQELRALPQGWLGRWSELLVAHAPDRQNDMLKHIRLIA